MPTKLNLDSILESLARSGEPMPDALKAFVEPDTPPEKAHTSPKDAPAPIKTPEPIILPSVQSALERLLAASAAAHAGNRTQVRLIPNGIRIYITGNYAAILTTTPAHTRLTTIENGIRRDLTFAPLDAFTLLALLSAANAYFINEPIKRGNQS